MSKDERYGLLIVFGFIALAVAGAVLGFDPGLLLSRLFSLLAVLVCLSWLIFVPFLWVAWLKKP